jgi:hypothetical protein
MCVFVSTGTGRREQVWHLFSTAFLKKSQFEKIYTKNYGYFIIIIYFSTMTALGQ